MRHTKEVRSPMETFTEPRQLVANARYADERRAALDALDLTAIDEPIVDVIEAFAALPHCYTPAVLLRALSHGGGAGRSQPGADP